MIAISDNVQIRNDGPCGTIVLNRPDCRNALSQEMVAMIDQALQDFYAERKIRAIVLTGTGETFCSGTDLYQIQETSEKKNALEVWHEESQAFLSLIEKMLRYPKPIIASVNGWAVGSGVSLMLASDIVIGGRCASILFPEALRGLSAGIATPLLSFRLGTGMASGILYSGKALNSDEACSMGLFHEVVDDDLVWARSFELAHQCAAGARESHQLTKQMINETIGENLYTQLSIGAANMAAARTTDAAKEGVAAFLEKREPVWD
ncbi:MAG: enoyl-CoA hydratase/isomerase family protein [Planctomycetota bacterium]